MRITIENTGKRQSASVTIDTGTCHYPYAIREAIELALKLDGHDEDTINEVFGSHRATVGTKKKERVIEKKASPLYFDFRRSLYTPVTKMTPLFEPK